MQISTILISLVLISLTDATIHARFRKPKLRPFHSHNMKSSEITKHKLPEERRQFTLFPKRHMKYVVSLEPIFKIPTHKPVARGPKKPLMKKLTVEDKRNKATEDESTEFVIDTRLRNTKFPKRNLVVAPKLKSTMISEEVSIEIVEEKPINSVETQRDKIEKVHKQINNKDIKANKVIKENLDNDSKEDESLDETEFIFADLVPKPTESIVVSSEELEDFITTEVPEPTVLRKKRSSNIIEEENLASTVAEYKYTWKDKRLNHDLAFKNVNS